MDCIAPEYGAPFETDDDTEANVEEKGDTTAETTGQEQSSRDVPTASLPFQLETLSFGVMILMVVVASTFLP